METKTKLDNYSKSTSFNRIIASGLDEFESFFEYCVDKAISNFIKNSKQIENEENNYGEYNIPHINFTIFENSNGKLTLNVEIKNQDISNIDGDLLVIYLEQYKHKNKINSEEITITFEEITINFDAPIINQYTFDLITSKIQEVFELNNDDYKNRSTIVNLNFTNCGLKNVDLTQYTVEELNEMKILSENARFDGCKINIEMLKKILSRSSNVYSRTNGNLSKLDISEIPVQEIENLNINTNKINLNLEGTKLSREQVKKILTTEGFLGRTKGDLSGLDLSGLDLRELNFDGANLENTNLTNAKISREHVEKILNLRDEETFLGRKKGDLRGFDLSEANLDKKQMKTIIKSHIDRLIQENNNNEELKEEIEQLKNNKSKILECKMKLEFVNEIIKYKDIEEANKGLKQFLNQSEISTMI